MWLAACAIFYGGMVVGTMIGIFIVSMFRVGADSDGVP